ncbi:MAG: STAS domain-containing protein [Candidatus Eisenbacteria bacterium]|uniref:STAS domain-containing protein n=1 Tax=Eiseniibacteriota bacterium TaxID=2212470 RepID=A0A538TV37_UNCEI|nr:MAG: STAS domain-containing protein [Candidatus Eisenbacteria bacterium]
MPRDAESRDARLALALNLELSYGRHGASARVELQERPHAAPGARRIARVTVRGWIDAAAERRLEQALDDLAARGVDQVLLDCAELRHIDYRIAPGLVSALERFEARTAGIVVCGLSRHLRDLFRLAGCEPRLRCWPSSSELFDAPRASEPSSERAS